MTEKEAIKKTIHFLDAGYVPWQINYTTRMGDLLVEALGLKPGPLDDGRDPLCRYDRLDDFLGNHIAYIRNRGVASVREIRAGIWRDEWGVAWDRSVDRDIGTPVNVPLASGSMGDLRVPDPDDPARYAHFGPLLGKNPHRYILVKFSYSLFERAWSLRGLENLLVDFACNPSFTEDLLSAVCDFNLAILDNLGSYPIDGVYFGDDWGSQKAMLMSPAMWRRFIKPLLQKMYGKAHARGYDVFIHCCGDISQVLDDLVDIGVNAFNPFQPEVMDVPRFAREYSGRLAFYGGVSIQKTLPFGSREEVREEIENRLSLGRRHGGLIISPSHDMPADIPVENVLAMLESLRNQ